eukprot:SAG22_NODE_3_length_48349_cov_158.681180_16_plen_260_part_00
MKLTWLAAAARSPGRQQVDPSSQQVCAPTTAQQVASPPQQPAPLLLAQQAACSPQQMPEGGGDRCRALHHAHAPAPAAVQLPWDFDRAHCEWWEGAPHQPSIMACVHPARCMSSWCFAAQATHGAPLRPRPPQSARSWFSHLRVAGVWDVARRSTAPRAAPDGNIVLGGGGGGGGGGSLHGVGWGESRRERAPGPSQAERLLPVASESLRRCTTPSRTRLPWGPRYERTDFELVQPYTQLYKIQKFHRVNSTKCRIIQI